MKLPRIAAVALVVLLVTAGAATAAPSFGSLDTSAVSNHGDEHGENESASADNDVEQGENTDADADNDADADSAADRGENAAANAADRGENAKAANGDASAANAQGPGGNLPEQVPDHVREIHATINQYLDGAIDNLGKAISDIV